VQSASVSQAFEQDCAKGLQVPPSETRTSRQLRPVLQVVVASQVSPKVPVEPTSVHWRGEFSPHEGLQATESPRAAQSASLEQLRLQALAISWHPFDGLSYTGTQSRSPAHCSSLVQVTPTVLVPLDDSPALPPLPASLTLPPLPASLTVPPLPASPV
jgi:hypothetical protein